MSIMRRRDWTERHIAFIESRRFSPFAWGSNDCGLFFADHCIEIADFDPAKRWRGYKSERGALTRIRRGGGLRAMMLETGVAEKPIGLAQRGDGVLVLMEGRETLGIVLGDGNWCGPGAEGWLARPMREAITVFGV